MPDDKSPPSPAPSHPREHIQNDKTAVPSSGSSSSTLRRMFSAYEVNPYFRHTDARYRCCCRLVHSKAASWVIALITALVCALLVVSLFLWQTHTALFLFRLLLAVLAFVVAVLMIYALKAEEPRILFVSYTVYSVLVVLLLLASAVLAVIGLLNPNEIVGGWVADAVRDTENLVGSGSGGDDASSTASPPQDDPTSRDAVQTVCALWLAGSVAGIAVQLWFALVVARAAAYLRDLRLARHPHRITVYHDNVAKYGTPATVAKSTSSNGDVAETQT